MNKKRHIELQFGDNVELTEKELKEGWHFCSEWDGLLINKYGSSAEAECCRCKL